MDYLIKKSDNSIVQEWGGTPIQGPTPASNTSEGRAR